MYNFSDIQKRLSTPKKIVITMHQKPDGDAMGSALGLYHYLLQLGHNAVVIAPTDFAFFLKWMPGSGSVMIAPFMPEKSRRFFTNTDIIFCLDFNDLNRLNEFSETVEKSPAYKVMIDHHTFPKDFANFRYCDEKASSTCELIHRFIVEMGHKHLINKEIATNLYTGIMTDTGSFRFDITTPAVHRAVADLMDTGIETHKIHEAIYDSFSEGRLRFWGHCFKECLRVIPEKKAAYFIVSKEEAQGYKIETGDTEGLVNYALGIRGIEFATLIIENPDVIKLSFRSKGDFGVNIFARNFSGGGHFHASGGKSHTTLAETEAKFLALLEDIHL